MVNCLTLITEVNLLLVSSVSSFFNMFLPTTDCTEINGTTALVSPKVTLMVGVCPELQGLFREEIIKATSHYSHTKDLNLLPTPAFDKA